MDPFTKSIASQLGVHAPPAGPGPYGVALPEWTLRWGSAWELDRLWYWWHLRKGILELFPDAVSVELGAPSTDDEGELCVNMDNVVVWGANSHLLFAGDDVSEDDADYKALAEFIESTGYPEGVCDLDLYEPPKLSRSRSGLRDNVREWLEFVDALPPSAWYSWGE
jgi:hypothetical protein